MSIRRRPPARAAAAAAICLTSLTVLGAGTATAHGTSDGAAARTKPAAQADGPAPSSSPQRDLSQGQTTDGSATPTRQQPARHTVAPGDTLWDIAQQTLGNPLLWESIYTLNQKTIEDAARRHGFASSDRGHWIFPGTVLTLTQKKQNRPDPATAARRPGPGSPAAKAALAKLQNRILDYVGQSSTRYTFGAFLDTTGRIVLQTDAPANVRSQLTDFSGEPEDQVQAIGDMEVVRGATYARQSRQNDTSPFSGGARIVGANERCSSGYAVQRPGSTFMVTAGHCFPAGTPVVTDTETETSYGTVSHGLRQPFPFPLADLQDMALIEGESYRGRIYTGDRESHTTSAVVGKEAAVRGGTIYCFSGSTSGESCGHTVDDTDGLACYLEEVPESLSGFLRRGCVWPAIVFEPVEDGGPLPQGGDSGGPFYSKDERGNAIISGHTIAAGVPFEPVHRVVGWAQSVDSVLSTYGVSLVTSPPE